MGRNRYSKTKRRKVMRSKHNRLQQKLCDRLSDNSDLIIQNLEYRGGEIDVLQVKVPNLYLYEVKYNDTEEGFSKAVYQLERALKRFVPYYVRNEIRNLPIRNVKCFYVSRRYCDDNELLVRCTHDERDKLY